MKKIIFIILLLLVIARCNEKSKMPVIDSQDSTSLNDTSDQNRIESTELLPQPQGIDLGSQHGEVSEIDDKLKQLIAQLGNGKKVTLDAKIMASLPSSPECRIAESKHNLNGAQVVTEGIYCLDPNQYKYIQVDIPTD